MGLAKRMRDAAVIESMVRPLVVVVCVGLVAVSCGRGQAVPERPATVAADLTEARDELASLEAEIEDAERELARREAALHATHLEQQARAARRLEVAAQVEEQLLAVAGAIGEVDATRRRVDARANYLAATEACLPSLDSELNEAALGDGPATGSCASQDDLP